jgi:glycosyltransferase involved in cell wall biosynthesis
MDEESSRMKILTVCYEYPPVGGGGGRVAAQISGALAARGHEVRVQTSRVGALPQQEENPAGVDVRRVFSLRQNPDTCSVPEMAAYVAMNAIPVAVAARSWRPDVMHVHFAVPTGPVAWFAHKVSGVPYVLTAHLGDVPGGAPEQTDHLFRIVRPFTVPVWRDAAAVTAVSSHVARLAHAAYGLSPKVILNGIASRSAVPPDTDPGGVLRLLFVGRMSVQKNPLFLAEILSAMRANNWAMTFVGDGPLRADLERLLRAKGLADKCEFRGWLDAAAVQECLGCHDVLLMPSLSEGLPVAGIEAVSRGLAMAGSNIPGLGDLIEDGVNGWSLPLDSARAWADVLDEAAADSAGLQRRKEESLRIATRFDLDKITDQYERVLMAAAGKSVSKK